MVPLKKSLEEAKITKDEVDEIILVGGSTRVPKIQSMLKEYFGKELNKQLNPDEAIAEGAAIQAGMMAGAQAVASDGSEQVLSSPLSDILDIIIFKVDQTSLVY